MQPRLPEPKPLFALFAPFLFEYSPKIAAPLRGKPPEIWYSNGVLPFPQPSDDAHLNQAADTVLPTLSPCPIQKRRPPWSKLGPPLFYFFLLSPEVL